MTLFGLSPAAFWLGALALGGGLVLLHLLRVRLRPVEVDTLLFFRLAGALQKPRVLPGAPARWLALALAALAVAAAWLAIAAPRGGLASPSRFVVVEPDLHDHPARLQQARELAGSGLGPRGAVLAATVPPVLLLAADEPTNALDARAAALAAPASPLGEAAALQAALDRRSPGDEVVWLGAAAPAATAPVAHAPAATAPAAALRGLRWQREAGGALSLVLRASGAGLAAELRAGGQVLANGTQPAGEGELRLGPIAPPAGAAAVSLAIAGADAPLEVPLPAGAPVRVFVGPDVPADAAAALAAVLQVDPELTRAPDAAAAEVVVAAADDPAAPLPRLVLTPGAGSAPRFPVLLPASPVPLSLRDRRRSAAPALPALPGAAVWLADAQRGDALVAATAARRVFVVDWLCAPITHSDVPVLLAGALRALGGRPAAPLPLAGQPCLAAAPFPLPIAAGTLLPVDGALPNHLAPGVARPFAVQLAGAAVAVPTAPPAPAAFGGAGAWAPWACLLLVILLLADAVLFHRARLP